MEVIFEFFFEIGVISKFNVGVKIFGNGKLEKKLIVKVNKFFVFVKEVVEVVGGIVEVI